MSDSQNIGGKIEEPRASEAETNAREENFEAIEKKAETESKKEEELIDQLAELQSKMSSGQSSSVATIQQSSLDQNIEQKKKKIIDAFLKSARAANFDAGKVEHIMNIAIRYLKKDYPDITDEIHDRIISEQNGISDNK